MSEKGMENLKAQNLKERCPSGLRCNLGKVVWGQLHRGFESLPLWFIFCPLMSLVLFTLLYYNSVKKQDNTEKGNLPQSPSE